MGLSVHEYDCMTYYDFELKASGFLKDREWYERIARRQAFVVFKGYADPKKTKKMTEEDMWSLPSEQKNKGKVSRTPAELAAAIKKINEQNGKTANRNRSEKQQRKQKDK